MRGCLRVFTFLVSAAVLVAMTGIAAAFPNLGVDNGNSCKVCHGPPPAPGTGGIRAGALAVIGQKTLDLGTQLNGKTRGALQTFTVTAGESVDLIVDVLDGSDLYAVELKRLETGGQKNDETNLLSAGAGYVPDVDWVGQGPLPATYYTSVAGSTAWGGVTTRYTFTLSVDPATPPDVYDLEFAVAGRQLDAGGRLKVYSDEHFYLEVLPTPVPDPLAVDVKVNGLDLFEILAETDNVSVDVTVAAGASDNVPADWFIVASTNWGWYYFDLGTGGFVPGLFPTLDGYPVEDVAPPYNVYDGTLPAGYYTFWFGVFADDGSVALDTVPVYVLP